MNLAIIIYQINETKKKKNVSPSGKFILFIKTVSVFRRKEIIIEIEKSIHIFHQKSLIINM